MSIEQDFIDINGEPIAGIMGQTFQDYEPPSWDVYFIRLSYEVAAKSKDPSTKFGAVIVKDNRPILFGYNGLPPLVNDFPERLVRPEKYKWTVHAEANAIACGAKFGISTNGTTLYISAMPCSGCAAFITAAGIKQVVLHKPAMDIFTLVSPYGEDDNITKKMFEEAKIELKYLSMFVGKTAYLGGRKYDI